MIFFNPYPPGLAWPFEVKVKPRTGKELLVTEHIASPQGNVVRFPVKRIATHPRPHWDEIFALWLLRKFGGQRYPGIHSAQLIFWDCGAGTPDQRPVGDHEKEGTLVLGVALSRLDEHARRRHKFGEMTCSAKLVAEDLGIDDDPALEPLLRYTSQQDSQGGTSPFDLAHLVKIQQYEPGDDAESNYRRVLHWAYAGITAKYEEQRRFIGPSRAEWAAKAKVFRLRLPGQTIRLGEIYSDDPQVAQCGRYYGCCQIIIQHGTRRDGCGNSQIFVSKKISLPHEFLAYSRRLGSSNPWADETLGAIRTILLQQEPRGLRAISGSLKWPEELRQIADAVANGDYRPPVYSVSRLLARFFRIEEYRKQGRNDYPFSGPALVARESLPDLPQWYLHPNTGWLFNGTRTAPQTPVSRIPREEWPGLIRLALIHKDHRDRIRLERSRAVVNDPDATPDGPPVANAVAELAE